MSKTLRKAWARSMASLRWLTLPFVLFALGACGGSGGGNDTVAVSGVVSDEVIVGATVELTDLTGKILGSATTDVNGRYSIDGVSRGALLQGYKVTTSGGTIGGVPFTATMTAIYSSSAIFTDSNITLITSAVTQAVTGAVPSGASPLKFLLERDAVVRRMEQAGVLTNADWNSVAPTGAAMLFFQQLARSRGAADTITGIAADFSVSGARCDSPFITPGTIHVYAPILTSLRGAKISRRIIGCVAGSSQDVSYRLADDFQGLPRPSWISIDPADGQLLRFDVPNNLTVDFPVSFTVVATALVNGKELTATGMGTVTAIAGEQFEASIGSAGGFVRDANGHPLVEIPAFAHTAAVTVTATVGHGKLSVIRAPSTRMAISAGSARMILRLPPGASGTAFMPSEACPAAVNSSVRECWTPGIIAPAFFGEGLGAKHRLSRNILETSDADATLQVEFGSQLTSSSAPSSIPGRIPVLFVHGYILGGGFGGGAGTWESLPTQVRKLPLPSGATPFLPFEFRWQTDASFISVANDLAQAVSAIYNATGSRVHIVAHSFGGVLARTLLQDITDATKGAPWSVASKVMSLTTVGTPHSGILRLPGLIETVPLPAGWSPIALADKIQCWQISCYQAGIAPRDGLVDFVRFDLSGNTQLDPPPAGYVVARLNLGINQSTLPSGVSLPILSLIGQSTGLSIRSDDFLFGNGDGLISYSGQRFKHDETTGRPELLFETQTNFGFIVSERVLGFEIRYGAFVGDAVTAAPKRSAYSTGNAKGYWHEGYFRIAAGGFGLGAGMVEVAVLEGEAALDCADPCHDTWANLRELLLSLHGGPASTNFPTTSGQLERVAGVNFNPNPAVVGIPLTVSVVGTNLSEGTNISLPGCIAWLPLSGGTTILRRFECVPAQAGSNLAGTVRSLNGAILFPFIVSVNASGSGNLPPVASFVRFATGLSISFDASASSDSDGTIVSYAWTFGDGGIGSGKLAAHGFASAGIYTVTLTVTDDKGATANTVQSITVSPVAPSQSASITQVFDDVGVSTGPLVQGATTDDATPTLSGTLSAALTATQTLRMFNGSTILGAATVSGTSWSFTPTALANGVYSFTAAVVTADGIEGSRAAAWSLTIGTGSVTTSVTVNPAEPVAGRQATFSVTGTNLRAGFTLSFPGCAATELASTSTTLRQFACTLTQSGSNLAGNVTTAAGTVLHSFVLTVAPSLPPPPIFGARIAAGWNHTCAITPAGGVKCWGLNQWGQLGDGTVTTRLTPVSVVGLESGVVAITASRTFAHTCALTSAGGVLCWGNNESGQLGDSTTVTRLTPANVTSLGSGVLAVSAGQRHTCALTMGGAVKCWGVNGFGELGDGTQIAALSPVNVLGLQNGVVAISLAAEHACALTASGGLKCWGRNDTSVLGDGTNLLRLAPVDVLGLSNGVAAVSAGYGFTCILTTVGGVRCRGSGLFGGELGDGIEHNSQTPVDVIGLSSGVTAIAGFEHTCALASAGAVWCWGNNFAGELGDGTTGHRSAPVAVIGLSSGVVEISVGLEHTCALIGTGAIKCWGNNQSGSLGDGTTSDRYTPVRVLGF